MCYKFLLFGFLNKKQNNFTSITHSLTERFLGAYQFLVVIFIKKKQALTLFALEISPF
jgi:hypothetical protein